MTRKQSVLLGVLVLALLPRLIQLESRPIGRHGWRQMDTASVARNFHENGYRLLHPQIDWDIPGYVEMEFPIYPWVTALGYGILGEAEWLARLLAVAGALATTVFLYLIVSRVVISRAGLWAAFFSAVLPLGLYFGRAIMPESWMLAATAAGIYWFLRWTEDNEWSHFVLSVVAVSIAVLLKLTNLYLGLPLLWLVWRKHGPRALLQWRVWLHAILVMLPVVLWYWHAYKTGQDHGASFNILTSMGSDKWGQWDLLISPEFYRHLFLGIVGRRVLTWSGTLLLAIALFLPRRTSIERLLDWWMLAVVIMLLIANRGAYWHEYYSLPLMLPAVGFMGKLFDLSFDRHRAVLSAAAIVLVALSFYRYFGYLQEESSVRPTDGAPHSALVSAGILADGSTPTDLVLSCRQADPTWLYLSHRRGWGQDCSRLDSDELRELSREGATLAFGRRGDLADEAGHRFLAHLVAFHEPLPADDDHFLVRILPEGRAKPHGWRKTCEIPFTSGAGLDGWTPITGIWTVESAGLVGTPTEGPARVVSAGAAPDCSFCGIEVELQARKAPGGGSTVELAGWWVDEGTHVALSLKRQGRKTIVALRQLEDGESLKTVQAQVPVRFRDLARLWVLYDQFEFQVYLNGELILTAPNRYGTQPRGTVALGATNESLVVRRLAVWTSDTD